MNGTVVLITGAARGIGAATAYRLAERGATVALAGLEPDLLREVTAGLPRPDRGAHLWFECDVTNQEATDRAVAETVSALGRIDVVVANAGIANLGTVAISPVEALIRTIDVNLLGTVRTVVATLPHVAEAQGYYLLVSSAAAFTALPGMAAYCASKAGVEQFGNALRLELAHRRVGVGVAHMSWIDTDMVRDVREDLPSFDVVRRRMPGPLGSYTSVDTCAEAFTRAIAKRSRRVFVPRSLTAVQLLRTLFTGPAAFLALRRQVTRSVPALEAEILRLGRSFGARGVG